ncbi:Prolactin-releasing peptide receptor [Sarcoptes scabiei]|uniref:Prolactin-releasing peptide receptor n=1 Tax=Sarcoptes scabiei TaxID=52283 RepID=A0A834R5I6_SARSC|nr:Prolactin-releasing peptide receptor [Sarcoptes scabiei]
MSNIIIVICFLILIIVSLCGNCLVCRMLIRQRKLCNNSTNILIGILAVSDLMMTAFNVPFTVADIILNDWIFGNFFCILVSFVQANSVYVSSFTMAVIAIDRCNAIYKFKPKNHSNDAHHQTSNANTEHRIDSEDNNNGIDFKNKISSSNDNHYKNHNSNNNHNDRNDGDFRKNFNHSDDNVDVDVDDDDDDEDDGDGGEGCENDDNSSSNNNNNNINNKSSYTILDRSEISNKIANDRKNIRNKKIQNARKNLDEQQQSINSNRRRIKLKNCSILERLNQIFRLCFGCCLAERKEPSRIRLRLQLRTRMILIISGIWIIAALHSLPHTIFNRVTVIETNKISNHNNLIVDRDAIEKMRMKMEVRGKRVGKNMMVRMKKISLQQNPTIIILHIIFTIITTIIIIIIIIIITTINLTTITTSIIIIIIIVMSISSTNPIRTKQNGSDWMMDRYRIIPSMISQQNSKRNRRFKDIVVVYQCCLIGSDRIMVFG